MNKEPSILIYDIENAPLLAYSWGPMYDANLLDIVEETYLLSYAHKWHGDSGPVQFNRKAQKKGDDKALVKKLWKLFDEADVVVAHNGDRFDQPKANTRFLKHGLGMPSPYIEGDTLTLARQKFKFTSNKLNEICKFLNIGEKLPTQGMHTWYGCMNNDPDAWKVMEEYNKRDVELLDELYAQVAPYVRTKVNLQAWSGTYRCVTCGSVNLESRGYRSRGGTERTHKNWKCLDCGKWNYELLSGVGKFRSV